ncbi:hypothetical protein C4E24_05070, partial [ANME-1 cluster archaeon AG-394-G21]|nr:hypothetical protein [ANME-1 cluster archaeon AG-394-G21]
LNRRLSPLPLLLLLVRLQLIFSFFVYTIIIIKLGIQKPFPKKIRFCKINLKRLGFERKTDNF